MQPLRNNLAIALLHYPVYNKRREIVTTALTNLDLHDIARSARTFGVSRFYVVTPSLEQRKLAARITDHWRDGWGASYNPDRKEALDIVRVLPTLDYAVQDLQSVVEKRLQTIVTGATPRPNSIDCQKLRELLKTADTTYLLLFGTGWGLAEECFQEADLILEPIAGMDDYNHLSVRSAVAITLDRLLAKP